MGAWVVPLAPSGALLFLLGVALRYRWPYNQKRPPPRADRRGEIKENQKDPTSVAVRQDEAQEKHKSHNSLSSKQLYVVPSSVTTSHPALPGSQPPRAPQFNDRTWMAIALPFVVKLGPARTPACSNDNSTQARGDGNVRMASPVVAAIANLSVEDALHDAW